jgi:hypothetical protein
MDDPGKVIVALGFFGTVTYIIRFVTLQIFGGQRGAPVRPELTEVHDDRLARLEQAVESIAIEVERISEGQRFTTRLLTERAQADQIRLSERPALERRPNSSH